MNELVVLLIGAVILACNTGLARFWVGEWNGRPPGKGWGVHLFLFAMALASVLLAATTLVVLWGML